MDYPISQPALLQALLGKKKCGHCQQWKLFSEFNKHKRTKDGYCCSRRE